jgi:methionyl-tRNA synthetase
MLRSAGLALPERVFAHGFVQYAGERFSKSAGVKLDLSEAIDRYGADAFRYFLLREVPFDADGNFSWERFEERYTADLANAFGNLASRTIAMIEKYTDGTVPTASVDEIARSAPWIETARNEYASAMNRQLLHEALAAAWRAVARTNEYVDRQAPWKLAKDPERRAELELTLATLTWSLAWFAVMTFPFMPGKAERLWEMLGAPGALGDFVWPPAGGAGLISPSAWRVSRGESLFPREEKPKVD